MHLLAGYFKQFFKFLIAQLRVWKCLADTQKLFDLKDECEKSLDKVTELESQFGVGDDIDDEEEEKSSHEDEDEVADTLIEKELLLSDSGKQN